VRGEPKKSMNNINHKYLSMAEATNICTYDQEYLSLLARRGLLQAEKIGRNWYTKREWLNNYLQKNRPNEVIRNEQESVQKNKGTFKNSKILKPSYIGIGVISIIMIFAFGYIVHRLNQLEQKAAKNAYIFNDIEALSNDGGNVKTNVGDTVKPDN